MDRDTILNACKFVTPEIAKEAQKKLNWGSKGAIAQANVKHEPLNASKGRAAEAAWREQITYNV